MIEDKKNYPLNFFIPSPPKNPPRLAMPLVHKQNPVVEKQRKWRKEKIARSSPFFRPLAIAAPFTAKKTLEGHYLDLGYGELLGYLIGKSGYLWDQIKSTPDPAIAEGLVDLVHALANKKRNNDASCVIIEYALQLAQKPSAIREIGELLFLTEYAFEDIVKELARSPLQSRLKNLLLEVLGKQLENLKSKPIAAVPIMISQILISSPNVFNRGLIPELKLFFNGDYPYQHHLNNILDAFDNSPYLRAMLRSIKAPISDPSSILVQMTLGNQEKTPWSIDAQQAAFVGLLGHMRQGAVSSCFAFFLGIHLLHHHVLKCLMDFKEMIETGLLTRSYQGKFVVFPLLEPSCQRGLQNAWISAIASMAENDHKQFISRRLMRCILKPLLKKFRIDWPGRTREYNKLKRYLGEIVSERARYLYDQQVVNKKNEDGELSYGVFILYDTQLSQDAAQWIRVDSQKRFTAFVSSLLTNQPLREFVASSEFIEESLFYYTATLSKEEQDHTPWLDKTGNDPMTVFSNYWQREFHPQSQTFTAANAEDLLIALITYYQNVSEPPKSAPLFINSSHACNFIVDNHNFKASLESIMPPRGWIYEKIIRPAHQILMQEIGLITAQKLIEEVKETFIQRKEWEKFNFACKLFKKNNAGILASELVKCLTEQFYIHQSVAENTVDTILFSKVLTDAERAILLENAVIIADSNWGESQYDIHFGFLYNLRTNQVELWKIRSDRTMALPLDQNDWVNGHCWEIL